MNEEEEKLAAFLEEHAEKLQAICKPYIRMVLTPAAAVLACVQIKASMRFFLAGTPPPTKEAPVVEVNLGEDGASFDVTFSTLAQTRIEGTLVV